MNLHPILQTLDVLVGKNPAKARLTPRDFLVILQSLAKTRDCRERDHLESFLDLRLSVLWEPDLTKFFMKLNEHILASRSWKALGFVIKYRKSLVFSENISPFGLGILAKMTQEDMLFCKFWSRVIGTELHGHLLCMHWGDPQWTKTLSTYETISKEESIFINELIEKNIPQLSGIPRDPSYFLLPHLHFQHSLTQDDVDALGKMISRIKFNIYPTDEDKLLVRIFYKLIDPNIVDHVHGEEEFTSLFNRGHFDDLHTKNHYGFLVAQYIQSPKGYHHLLSRWPRAIDYLHSSYQEKIEWIKDAFDVMSAAPPNPYLSCEFSILPYSLERMLVDNSYLEASRLERFADYIQEGFGCLDERGAGTDDIKDFHHNLDRIKTYLGRQTKELEAIIKKGDKGLESFAKLAVWGMIDISLVESFFKTNNHTCFSKESETLIQCFFSSPSQNGLKIILSYAYHFYPHIQDYLLCLNADLDENDKKQELIYAIEKFHQTSHHPYGYKPKVAPCVMDGLMIFEIENKSLQTILLDDYLSHLHTHPWIDSQEGFLQISPPFKSGEQSHVYGLIFLACHGLGRGLLERYPACRFHDFKLLEHLNKKSSHDIMALISKFKNPYDILDMKPSHIIKELRR